MCKMQRSCAKVFCRVYTLARNAPLVGARAFSTSRELAEFPRAKAPAPRSHETARICCAGSCLFSSQFFTIPSSADTDESGGAGCESAEDLLTLKQAQRRQRALEDKFAALGVGGVAVPVATNQKALISQKSMALDHAKGSSSRVRISVTLAKAIPDILTDAGAWWEFFDCNVAESTNESCAEPSAGLSLSEMVFALMRSFRLPRAQKPALMQLLKKTWRFPMSKEEALSSGQVKRDARVVILRPKEVGLDWQKARSPMMGFLNQGYEGRVVGYDYKNAFYHVETYLNPSDPLTPPEVLRVKRDNLHTILPRMYQSPEDGRVFVRGCRGAGETCNGDYGNVAVRIHNGYPVYRNVHGAIIYWNAFWKMNVTDDMTSWYYSFEVADKVFTEPPEGEWSNFGYFHTSIC